MRKTEEIMADLEALFDPSIPLALRRERRKVLMAEFEMVLAEECRKAQERVDEEVKKMTDEQDKRIQAEIDEIRHRGQEGLCEAREMISRLLNKREGEPDPVSNKAHCIRCGCRMNFPASMQRPGVDIICMDCLCR